MTELLKSRIAEDKAITESALSKYLAYTDPGFAVLFDSMRYSVDAGGKRIRPFLVFEFCRLFGGDIEAAVPFACAIEMIHTYSLIHDDLPCMDNDDLRRGKPTNHKVYGEATALLAGDALLTYAMEIAASNDKVSPSCALEAVKLLAKGAGPRGMIGGQQLDLIGEEVKYELLTLRRMQELKTGELILASCFLGVLAAGGDAAAKSAASGYACGIGPAFQIIDDMLDVTSDAETLGKNVGMDAVCGKTTFMTYMTLDEAYSAAKELTEHAVMSVKDYANSDVLCEFAEYLLNRRN